MGKKEISIWWTRYAWYLYLSVSDRVGYRFRFIPKFNEFSKDKRRFLLEKIERRV